MTVGKIIWAILLGIAFILELVGVFTEIPTLTQFIIQYIPWWVTLVGLLVLAWHFATVYRNRKRLEREADERWRNYFDG